MTTTAHDNAREAPPADVQREPTRDERAEQIAEVTRQLDQRFSRQGEPLGPTRTLTNLDRIVKRDPWFRRRLAFNGLTEAVEWEGRRMRDEDVTRIRLAIAHTYGVEFGIESTHAVILETARQLTYHPIVRYLKRLMWDREPRIDRFLVDYLGVEDTPLHRAISRRWFVACVARAMGKGETPVKVDICRAPAPRSAETVKAFLSAPTDRYRPPYGRTVVESHRQCVFVGTTNAGQFLSDPTGSRRFLPVTVGKIEIDRIREDRDLLWAEALAAYRAGEVWWLSREEDAQLVEAQEQYQHADPWIVVIERWLLDPQNAQEAARGMVVGDVLTRAIGMDTDRQRKGDEMRLSAVLQAMGWDKRRAQRNGKRARLWFPSAG